MKKSTYIGCWLFFGFIAIFFLVGGVRALLDEEYPSVITACALVVTFGAVLSMLPKAYRRNVLPCIRYDATGTTVRPDRGIDVPTMIVVVSMTLAAILIAVLLPMGRLDIPMSPTGRYGIPFTAGALAVYGLPFVIAFLRRRTTKFLCLTPDGFEIAEGLRSQHGRWADVADVTNAAPGKPLATVGSISIVMPDGTTLNFAAGGCTPSGTALRDLVRYYWRHPEARSELTDHRAGQRLIDLIEARPA